MMKGMKEMTSKVCYKKDCIYQEQCQNDQVKVFLCGVLKHHYMTKIPLMVWNKIDSKFKEIKEANAHQLSKIGSELGVERSNFDTDQYRLLLLYKVQEDERARQGIPIPKRVQDTISNVLVGIRDGLVLHKKEKVPTTSPESGKEDEMATKKKAKKKNGKAVGNGKSAKDIALACIKKKMSSDATIEAVHKAIPGSKFSKYDYNRYKSM